MIRLSERSCTVLIAATIATAFACSGANTGVRAAPEPMNSERAQTSADTGGLIPAGFGSLRQEDISLSVAVNGLRVRALPMDEDFIRTLAPDSYSALRQLRESRRATLDTIARRTGVQRLSVWSFQFFNEQQGEAPFAPRDVILTNQGRDFKPLDAIGQTSGFGEGRVRQGQIQTGILVFDGAVNPNQPLTLKIGTEVNANWENVLKRVESERARVRSRAGGK